MTGQKIIGVILLIIGAAWLWYLLLPLVSEKYGFTQPRPPKLLWGGMIVVLLLGGANAWWISYPNSPPPPQTQVLSTNQSGGVAGNFTGDVIINNNVEDRKSQLKLNPRVLNAYILYYPGRTAYLAILLEIGNSGEKSSTAHDFTLTVPGKSIPGVVTNANEAFHFLLDLPPNHMDMVLLTEEFLQRRCSTVPIAPGAAIRGWLFFEIPESPDVATASPSITFRDIQDQLHSVPLQNIHRVPPLPAGELFMYSDVTSPFRERSIIERIIKQRNVDTTVILPGPISY